MEVSKCIRKINQNIFKVSGEICRPETMSGESVPSSFCFLVCVSNCIGVCVCVCVCVCV